MNKNRSKTITFFLLLFFGLFGLHRIYLGKVRSAMIYIFIGILGISGMPMLFLFSCIWWWMDLISLLNGKLTDIDGNKLV